MSKNVTSNFYDPQSIFTLCFHTVIANSISQIFKDANNYDQDLQIMVMPYYMHKYKNIPSQVLPINTQSLQIYTKKLKSVTE